MVYSTNVWNQLRNISVEEIISKMLRDGWQEDSGSKTSGTRAFIKDGNQPKDRIVIHYHPRKTYGPKFLQGLLESTGWTEDDMRRLKLIK